jgi:hypothetical protein
MGQVVTALASIARSGPMPAPMPMHPQAPGFHAPAPGSQPPQPPPPLVARLDELVGLVRGLEHRLATATTGGHVARFDVALDASSPSNFFLGLGGADVASHGGIFVSTYAKLPHLGAPVALALEMPGGVSFEVFGVVAWTQDDLGDASPPGFGARITSLPDEARAMISAFTRGREPLLREP